MSNPMVDAKYFEAVITTAVEIAREMNKKYKGKVMWYLDKQVQVLSVSFDEDLDLMAHVSYKDFDHMSDVYLGFLSEQPQ